MPDIKWIAAAFAAILLTLPITASAQPHPCEHAYRKTLRDCRDNHAMRCDQAQREQRRACHRNPGGYRCEERQRIASDVCSAHAGCRREAEHSYRACRRDFRGHQDHRPPPHGYYR